jgi:hypothetical protein
MDYMDKRKIINIDEISISNINTGILIFFNTTEINFSNFIE